MNSQQVVPAFLRNVDPVKYDALVTECKSIYAQLDLISKRVRIIMYGLIGQEIYTNEIYKKFAHGNHEFLTKLFEDIGIKQTSGYCAIKFYEVFVHGKFESVEACVDSMMLTEPGLSWHRVKTEYLPSQRRGKSLSGPSGELLEGKLSPKNEVWEFQKPDSEHWAADPGKGKDGTEIYREGFTDEKTEEVCPTCGRRL